MTTATDLLTQDMPVGLALTSLVGTYYKTEDVAQCFINLHYVLAKGKAPLTFHFPEAPAGFHWALMPDVAEIKPQWWAGLTPPFQAYAQPAMEKRIVCFATETSQTVKEFRRFDYPMNVSRTGGGGLRFKVSDYDPQRGTPELWCLAYQTQAQP